MMEKLQVKINQSHISDILFISSVTFGIILLLGGLFSIFLASNIPAKVSGVESMTQSIAFVINLIPGVPLSFTELTNSGLVMVGFVSWIIGLDILLVGLGLFVKNPLAKWVALGTFSLAAIMHFVGFLLYGVLGSPDSVFGIATNGIFIYLLTKANY